MCVRKRGSEWMPFGGEVTIVMHLSACAPAAAERKGTREKESVCKKERERKRKSV